jgi:hypothetical protein
LAKCWFCKTTKGKRYCSPIENLLCPVCCAENRLKKIDCHEDCRYLEGVAFQKKREEEKEFSSLMGNIPHGQHDDIFHDIGVALVAGEIETFVSEKYVSGNINLTDQTVYGAYKQMYKLHFNNQIPEERHSDNFFQELEKLYFDNKKKWEHNVNHEKIGQVFLRLMISIKKMSGGQLGEFGYLNYLKNNFVNIDTDGQFIVEDKFGNKTVRTLKS